MSAHVEVKCSSKCALLPVTALRYTTVGASRILLAGVGPWLKVFSERKQLLCEEVLKGKKIHGIHTGEVSQQQTVNPSSCRVPLVVYGQRALRILELVKDRGTTLPLLRIFSELIELNDWILDTICVSYTSVDQFQLLIITAHNNVLFLDTSSSSDLSSLQPIVYSCDVQCILYSAELVKLNEAVFAVASGTVFNRVLLWTIQLNNDSKCSHVCAELHGHEGVIFAVRFATDLSQLASVSDDRTIRVWRIPSDCWSLRNKVISAHRVLYGHTARVWDVVWIPQYLLSIGEDATCRVWDQLGNTINTITGHRGRSIWSIAYDDSSEIVATGGEDGAIRMIQLNKQKPSDSDAVHLELPTSFDIAVLPTSSQLIKPPHKPRCVALWGGHSVVCLTDTGCVLKASTQSCSSWSLVHSDIKYAGYSVMTIASVIPLVALGNLSGDIKLINLATNSITEWTAHKGKVFSICMVVDSEGCCEDIVSCGPDGEMVYWRVTQETPHGQFSISQLASFVLPPSKHRWLTSVAVFTPQQSSSDSLLVCGDRKGSVHVYNMKNNGSHPDQLGLKLPLQTLQGVHGSNGVTHILYHRGSVFSCGRDGHCIEYNLNDCTRLEEKNKFKPVKGMDMVEQIYFSHEHDLLVAGFHAADFVLYSTRSNTPLVTVSCGGGHRSYALFPSLSQIENAANVCFVYIKSSRVYLVHLDNLEPLFKPVIQEHFLGREAVAIELIYCNTVTGSSLVAVGGEDCNISLVGVSQTSSGSVSLSMLGELHGHISSVRALTAVEISQHHTLLFSGGGRASMRAWMINTAGLMSDGGATSEGSFISLQCDYHLHLSSRWRRRRRRQKHVSAVAPECRVMALTAFSFSKVTSAGNNYVLVAAGCSDGIVRLYIYDISERQFSLFDQLDHHHHCLLSVKHAILEHSRHSDISSSGGACHGVALLCTAATDGQLAFWDITHLLLSWMTSCLEDDNAEPVPIEQTLGDNITSVLVHTVTVHQSGVNDLAIITNCMLDAGDHELTVASVGDDSALVITRLAVTLDESSEDSSYSAPRLCLVEQAREDNAHHSSISGVQVLSNGLFITTSVDQRLSIWKLSKAHDQGKLFLGETNSIVHDVADAADMLTYQTNDGSCVVLVCGVGLECLRLENLTPRC